MLTNLYFYEKVIKLEKSMNVTIHDIHSIVEHVGTVRQCQSRLESVWSYFCQGLVRHPRFIIGCTHYKTLYRIKQHIVFNVCFHSIHLMFIWSVLYLAYVVQSDADLTRTSDVL